jgi:hypothetical protein
VTVLVIVLVLTNLATLGAALYLRARPAEPAPGGGPAVEAALAATPAAVTVQGTRRMISIEILNPIELAGTRGRVMGIAGSLAPGLTRRIVYDQIVKTLRAELAEKQVVADVQLHVLRPAATTASPPPGGAGGPAPLEVHPVSYVDELDEPIDVRDKHAHGHDAPNPPNPP